MTARLALHPGDLIRLGFMDPKDEVKVDGCGAGTGAEAVQSCSRSRCLAFIILVSFPFSLSVHFRSYLASVGFWS
jgi:hypothetical protein